MSGLLAVNSQADPADDALAKLNELSRQAEQTTEAMHSAQLDLNNKLAAQEAAESVKTTAQEGVESVKQEGQSAAQDVKDQTKQSKGTVRQQSS